MKEIWNHLTKVRNLYDMSAAFVGLEIGSVIGLYSVPIVLSFFFAKLTLAILLWFTIPYALLMLVYSCVMILHVFEDTNYTGLPGLLASLTCGFVLMLFFPFFLTWTLYAWFKEIYNTQMLLRRNSHKCNKKP